MWALFEDENVDDTTTDELKLRVKKTALYPYFAGAGEEGGLCCSAYAFDRFDLIHNWFASRHLLRGLFKSLPNLYKIEAAMFACIRKILFVSKNVIVLFGLVLFTFACAGIQIFGGLSHQGNPALAGSDYLAAGYEVVHCRPSVSHDLAYPLDATNFLTCRPSLKLR